MKSSRFRPRFVLHNCIPLIWRAFAKQFGSIKEQLVCFFTRTISFDKDWLFKKDSSISAEGANFDDATWRKLDLPHDWSIEDLQIKFRIALSVLFQKLLSRNAMADF